MKTKRFENHNVLITGGGNGLGQAAAERFAKEGAAIAFVDTDSEGLEKTETLCRAAGAQVLSFHRDVTDRSCAKEVTGEILKTWSSIDTLVCSAGVYKGLPIQDVSYEDWLEVLNINLTGTFLFNQALVPLMQKQKQGSIINISSMAGKTSWDSSSQYSASKSGVIGLTRSVAMDLAPYGATANALCPGNTLTDMVKNVAGIIGKRLGQTAQEWLDMRANDCPMKRLAQPWEMAGVITFLASEDSRYLTGQSLEVDGGMVLS